MKKKILKFINHLHTRIHTHVTRTCAHEIRYIPETALFSFASLMLSPGRQGYNSTKSLRSRCGRMRHHFSINCIRRSLKISSWIRILRYSETLKTS